MMNHRPVSLADLADWLDDRLDEKTREKVSKHLAAGCPTCQRDLAWLRRVTVAARGDDMAEPPAEVVAKAKALYSSGASRRAIVRPRPALVRLPRLVVGFAMVLVLALSGMFVLSRTPTFLSRTARLASSQDAVQIRSPSDLTWRGATEGDGLAEGDQVRVAGEAVLVLFDGSTLRMQENSELSLIALRSGLFGGSRRIALEQQTGSVEYDVAVLPSPYSTFEVHSPTMRVVVRGTRFVITVSTPQESVVTVLQGNVQVENAVGSALLSERDVAVVQAEAPVMRLATLTPTATPTPTHAAMPIATPTSVATASETLVPTRGPSSPIATRALGPDWSPTTEVATLTATETLPVHAPMTPTPITEPTSTPGIMEISGPIERLPPHLFGVWQIGGRDVVVTPVTRIEGEPAAGLHATATCLASPATRASRAVLLALRVRIEAGEPKPSETPSPTAWSETGPTATPSTVASPVLPPVMTLLPPLVRTAVQPWITLVPWPPAHHTRTPRATDVARPPSAPSAATDTPVVETTASPPVDTATPVPGGSPTEGQSTSAGAIPSVPSTGLGR